MIFITVGSQKFPFYRLLKEIDELISQGVIREEVVAQIGYTKYKPQNYEYKEFLDRSEFVARMERADIVITHGGTGAIISAVKKGKRVIAIPRLQQYGEHVDDHQKQIVKQFSEMGIILACYELIDLGEKIEGVRKQHFKPYISSRESIMASIEAFIQ